MIYPNNFEQKIEFNEIRALLNERCQSTLGKEKVAEMQFSKDAGFKIVTCRPYRPRTKGKVETLAKD